MSTRRRLPSRIRVSRFLEVVTRTPGQTCRYSSADRPRQTPLRATHFRRIDSMTQRNTRTTMRQGLATLLCLTSVFIGVAGMRADAQTTALVARTAVDTVDVIARDNTQ